MAKTKKKVKPTKPKTDKKPVTRKKYQSRAGLDCLDCNLPASVCCGQPKRCRALYEKQLAQKAAAAANPPTHRRRRQNENCVWRAAFIKFVYFSFAA